MFQFYPESDDQVTFIMSFATKAGFGGGLCVDYVSARNGSERHVKTASLTSTRSVQPNSTKK